MEIRQPIVTVVGHVDHGKTTILDKIRETAVASKEAGGITQIISFTTFPSSILKEKCKTLLNQLKINLTIPGFLFIDTPGHAAFTNLRKRGGALADVAILVIDINEGIMPQTAESIEILKANKIPFVVALNKTDAIGGWQKKDEEITKSIAMQGDYVRKSFETKLYKILGSLAGYGFDSDLFYNITDFTKQIALIPCSGKTGEGISELLGMLAGLSQKFLIDKLELHKEARGTILEIKRDKNMLYLESIIYDGTLKVNDTLVIGGFEKPIVTKIRVLFEALPLGKGFKSVKETKAAAGIRMQVHEAVNILPGMPFIATEDIEEAQKEVQKEITEIIQLDPEGVVIKAESLGSLEALIMLLKKEGIMISKVGIGNINKIDVASAAASLKEKPLDAIVLGFNVSVNEDVIEEDVKILKNAVIYKLIEDFELWREQRQKEIDREKLSKVTMPCKIKVLKYVFRKNNPAIFGVKIESGTLKPETVVMRNGEKIGRIKAIQSEGKGADLVKKGQEVAISIPGITYGRHIQENDILYPNLSETEFRKLKENKRLLIPEEITILQEIAQIKRQERATWGF